jgi:SAM-dependent methyltransferase
MFAPDVLGPAVKKLTELAGDGSALEFAIGTGRVAIPLSESGIKVSGIELSAPMLAKLRTKADAATIPVVLGDMTTAQVPGRFSLVFLVFNGISNVLTADDQQACVRNAARHLEPRGRFVVENWIPDLPPPPPAPQAVVGHSEPGYIEVDTFDLAAQVVISHHFRFGDDGAVDLFRSPHRYVWPEELDTMAHAVGFKLDTRHADWSGAQFKSRSRAHIPVYRKS